MYLIIFNICNERFRVGQLQYVLSALMCGTTQNYKRSPLFLGLIILSTIFKQVLTVDIFLKILSSCKRFNIYFIKGVPVSAVKMSIYRYVEQKNSRHFNFLISYSHRVKELFFKTKKKGKEISIYQHFLITHGYNMHLFFYNFIIYARFSDKCRRLSIR